MVEMVLHSVMTKRSQGQSTFGRTNFKKRLFILTNTSISYNTGRELENSGSLKGEIKLSSIRAIEEVDTNTFPDQNGFPFQIIHNEGGSPLVLYIIAGLRADRDQWVKKLRKLISCNNGLQATFHTGIFDKNSDKWSCCGGMSVESNGCRNTYYHKNEVERRNAVVEVKAKPFTVIAIWDLTAQQPNTDLNLRRGEKLEILDATTDQHWWRGRNGAGQEGFIPESYVQRDGIESRQWYHNIDSRTYAETLLKDNGRDCTFLVRPSARGKVNYSISLYYLTAVKHYHIQQAEGLLWVNERNKFPSVDELIEYHSLNCAGMVCRLRYPLVQDNKPPLIGNPFGQYLISPTEVVLDQQIGYGQFGVVYKGRWKNFTVAIKTMKEGCMNEDDFFDEAKIMMKFKHPNLIRFHGISKKNPVCILTEFMQFGCLFKYLQSHPHIATQIPTVIDMSSQIASAMKYLEDNMFIHRDLAARNCLVGHQQVVKVADFGLSRFVTDDEYTASEGVKFPIKWSSPEVIDYGRYSSKSDIWSYGVTLWEILSAGQTPYRDLTNQEVMAHITRGMRLLPPPNSTANLTTIMGRCWLQNPEERITFSEIVDILHTLQFEC